MVEWARIAGACSGMGERKGCELDGESGEDDVSFSLSCEGGVRSRESP